MMRKCTNYREDTHGQRPVSVIDDQTGIPMLGPQECWRHIKRVRQDLSISDPKSATVKGDQAPFVEVGTDAIGVFVDGVELQGLSVFRHGQSGTGPLIASRGKRQPQPMPGGTGTSRVLTAASI